MNKREECILRLGMELASFHDESDLAALERLVAAIAERRRAANQVKYTKDKGSGSSHAEAKARLDGNTKFIADMLGGEEW